MNSTCCFCLGDETDVPPFGSKSETLINPCTTCKLDCHRKCLLDWFNTIPSDKLKIINGLRQAEYIGVGAPPALNETIEINLSPQTIQNWLNNLVEDQQLPLDLKKNQIYIFAPCPQCKKEIVFKMHKNSLLTVYSTTKTIITRFVQYGGVFLGLTSALTGILSLGYISLTSIGLKVIDCIIPNSLLIKLLSKKSSLFSNNPIFKLYSIDNLEQALMKGLVDPLKFSRIPILPIVLFRLRSSSILRCLFPEKEDSQYQNWVNELMISGYISSFNDHRLIRDFLKGKVNLNSTGSILSLLVPLRWIYDIIYRLTFNRIYFNYTMKIRPRSIVNNLSEEELLKLEDLNEAISKTNSWKLKMLRFYKNTLICLKNDYSMSLSYGSTIIKCITTLCWPFISSKIGNLIIPFIKSSKEKKILIANIIGLFIVAIGKEFINLHLTRLKVKQMSQLSTLTNEELEVFKKMSEKLDEIVPEIVQETMPGNYP